MRAYDVERFRAGNSLYYGTELRISFSEDPVPVNLFFIGGIKTLLQVAFFAEAGSVNDNEDLLDDNLKTSYGVGFRATISKMVYRLDIAIGDEGTNITIFIDYPLDINPIVS
ncbi:MAG: hypothetical protein GY866_05450 [Proteobacteria bacterium]|nr:hypothetical protein [Pseudomonadota bacterium]